MFSTYRSHCTSQGFVIVYNPLEKDTFDAAQALITDLQAKMAKPESEEEEVRCRLN